MNQREVKDVIRTGQRLHTPLVTIYRKQLSPLPARPLAVVVSKKIARQATARHKLQRWLREAERHLRGSAAPAAAMVWIARSQITGVERWQELVASLEKHRATLGGLAENMKNR